MTVRILSGDCRDVLPTLEPRSVQCVVTSPPYFGLRDYGTAQWDGGNPECDHVAKNARNDVTPERLAERAAMYQTGQGTGSHVNTMQFRDVCGKCGAVRVDRQMGLEPTLTEYITGMVNVFRLVRDVLADDGTVWLNIGSSYGPDKCDLMVPSRLALAMIDDGWILRSQIVWAKPNPMPESVRDRPTSSYEHIYLFAKGQWKSRIVKFSNLPTQRFHFSEYFRSDGLTVRGSARLPIDLATAIFNCTQRQDDFSLPPFHSEVWQNRADGSDSDFVRCLPEDHRPAVWAARFLSADATAEQFLCEIDRLRIAHADDDHFLERWATTDSADSPRITCDGNRTITVNYSGEVCKVDFVHHAVSISCQSGCSYYYDADAIAEPVTESSIERLQQPTLSEQNGSTRANGGAKINGNMKAVGTVGTRNCRNVWTIATQPYSGAHFATFPPEIPRRCILAGTSERGQCPACGKPWVRVTESERIKESDSPRYSGVSMRNDAEDGRFRTVNTTTGWQSQCECDAGDPVPQTVLDPFGGAGTTGMVADRLGRNAILIELNDEYATLARNRIHNDAPMFAEVTT
jgi:DNA modification methylase